MTTDRHTEAAFETVIETHLLAQSRHSNPPSSQRAVAPPHRAGRPFPRAGGGSYLLGAAAKRLGLEIERLTRALTPGTSPCSP
jgi:hypothetical protein